MISYNKTSLSIIATALLTACGGDSSNSSQPTTGPDPVEPPTSSTLSFRDSTTRVFLTGQTILNPAISTAADEVTYRSSNSNVARVLGDGKIETLAPGSATIYADSVNGSASWPIEVEQPHIISAWIGDTGSDLFLDNLPNNSRVFSAASEQCIAVDNSSCGHWLTIDDNGWSNDQTLTTNTPRYYSVVHGDYVRQLQVSAETLEAKLTYSFNGSLWGWDIQSQGNDSANMLWSSQRGSIWKPEVAQLPNSKLLEGHIAHHDNKVWLLGAFANDSAHSCNRYDDLSYEIWSSDNGKDWRYVADLPEGTPADYSFLSHNNQLWLAGNQLYSSTDGVNWQIISNPTVTLDKDLGFSEQPHALLLRMDEEDSKDDKSYYPTVFSHHDKLWAVHIEYKRHMILVSSVDGQHWQQEEYLDDSGRKFDPVQMGNKTLLFDLNIIPELSDTVNPKHENHFSRCFFHPQFSDGDMEGGSPSTDGIMIDGEYHSPASFGSYNFNSMDWAFLQHNHQMYAIKSNGETFATEYSLPWQEHGVAKDDSRTPLVDHIHNHSDINLTVFSSFSTASNANEKLLFISDRNEESNYDIDVYNWKNSRWSLKHSSVLKDLDHSGIKAIYFNDLWWLFTDTGYEEITVFASTDAKTWQQRAKLDLELGDVTQFSDRLWLTTDEDFENGHREQLLVSTDGVNWQPSELDMPSPWRLNTGQELDFDVPILSLSIFNVANQLVLSAEECFFDIWSVCESRTYVLKNNQWHATEGQYSADYIFNDSLFTWRGDKLSPANGNQWLSKRSFTVALPE
jgi:hypothetical protein